MIRASQYTKTFGTEKFRIFISQKFTIDMLYPIYNDKSCETLFDNWHGKDMLGWHRFKNDDKIILEFYPTYYTIKKDVPNAISYMLSIPQTINDFISDLNRFNIQLYWTNWVDENFEPKDYLNTEEIKPYYEDLLGKMGKSFELT